MTRKKLITSLAQIASECGFGFHTGFDYRIPHEVKKFPAAWLMPPKLLKTEGRHEGTRHYEVRISLLGLPAAPQNEAAREDELARLEKAALKMSLMLGANDAVRTITDAEYIPAEASLTAAGEVSISFRLRVQMPFCSEL